MKGLRVLLFIVVCICGSHPAVDAVELGDVNTDNVVNIIDALLTAQYTAGLAPANFNATFANVNCLSAIDIVDALLIARYSAGLINTFPCSTTPTPAPTPTSVSMSFITRNGTKLYEDGKEYRFVSVNIPNYFILENRAGTSGSKWHRVTAFEQKDAVRAVKRLGGQLFRTYVFSVQGGVNVENNLAHITGTNGHITYNEQLFQDVDRGIAIAAEEGVRLYIPLVDNWQWFGGYAEWANICGGGDFWTSTTIKTKFKEFITWLVNRRNTVTNVLYKDDPTIMAWELGNEIDKANSTWISEMAAHLKNQDPNHLVIDGGHKSIPQASLDSPYIDIITTHYTDNEIANFIKRAASYNKPYIYGEYSPDSSVQNIIDTVISGGGAGCLIWSLRFRSDLGGFYFHQDFSGDSLQYPGIPADSRENQLFTLLRNRAYSIRGLSVPQEPVPPAPVLLPVSSPNAINWQGSAGALSYVVQRSTSANGDWTNIATGITDIQNINYDGQLVAKLPLYSDSPGKGTWYYRIIAVNKTGQSLPSNVVSVLY